MYSLVDFHQDGWSRWSLGGCGEGFPQWTVPVDHQVTPVNDSSIDDIKAKGCYTWGIESFANQFIDFSIKSVFQDFMVPGNSARNAYLAMMQKVGSELLGETGIVGFDLINEPLFVDATFFGDVSQSIISSGWSQSDTIFFIEPSMSNQTCIKPSGFPNLVYAPHYYDFRTILDGVYNQLKYFLSGGVMDNLVSSFINNPSEENHAKLMAPVQSMANIMTYLTEKTSQHSNFTDLHQKLSTISTNINDAKTNLLTQTTKTINKPLDIFLQIAIRAIVGTLSLTLNIFLFTPYIGAFDILADILKAIKVDTDSAIGNLDKQGSGCGLPFLLGEFGCNQDARFVDAGSYVESIMKSSDKVLGSFSQWTYQPLWNPTTKDGWNGENFSIVQGLSGPLVPNHIPNRPYPMATAGTPTSLNITKTSLSYSYVSSKNNSLLTEIKFNEAGVCGSGKVAKIVGDGVGCGFLSGRSVVQCGVQSGREGSVVSVGISCA
ncbi:hypothetical protein HDU76_007149 [Blyttiomyces sp. JEL0837]|nr:hypothetical protein HDU76_007149 [Blyttiomyces sp. JEL0837]